MNKNTPKKLTEMMKHCYFESTSPARYHACISISERYKSGKLSVNQMKYWDQK